MLLTNVNFCAGFVMYCIKLNEAVVGCIKTQSRRFAWPFALVSVVCDGL